MDKIKTGSIYDVAEVLRDLYRLKTNKQLSFGERRMLDTARSLIVKEIAIAREQTEERREERDRSDLLLQLMRPRTSRRSTPSAARIRASGVLVFLPSLSRLVRVLDGRQLRQLQRDPPASVLPQTANLLVLVRRVAAHGDDGPIALHPTRVATSARNEARSWTARASPPATLRPATALARFARSARFASPPTTRARTPPALVPDHRERGLRDR